MTYYIEQSLQITIVLQFKALSLETQEPAAGFVPKGSVPHDLVAWKVSALRVICPSLPFRSLVQVIQLCERVLAWRENVLICC
jgi:hypothetical protein